MGGVAIAFRDTLTFSLQDQVVDEGGCFIIGICTNNLLYTPAAHYGLPPTQDKLNFLNPSSRFLILKKKRVWWC